MTGLPKIVYVAMDQIVPDLDKPATLETNAPTIQWLGKEITLKEASKIYVHLVSPNPRSEAQVDLKKALRSIINEIHKKHPDYFRRCMSQ